MALDVPGLRAQPYEAGQHQVYQIAGAQEVLGWLGTFPRAQFLIPEVSKRSQTSLVWRN